MPPISPLSVQNLNPPPIKLEAIPISEAPEGLYEQLMGIQEDMLKMQYTEFPDLSNHPAYQEYAQVIKNGKVVAKIDNQGCVTTPHGLPPFTREFPGDIDGETGPVLAKARAAMIAEASGGVVVKSSTSLTQSQYNDLEMPEPTIDYKAMKEDPRYAQLLKLKEARTLFLTQQIAQLSKEDALPE
ncbi:MAG: hypothetical protein K0R63_447 [Rickettsiales bacterium]|jgi:hypothetical protein|nr:hypothetical protein [Rickettsiales bacterium]